MILFGNMVNYPWIIPITPSYLELGRKNTKYRRTTPPYPHPPQKKKKATAPDYYYLEQTLSHLEARKRNLCKPDSGPDANHSTSSSASSTESIVLNTSAANSPRLGIKALGPQMNHQASNVAIVQSHHGEKKETTFDTEVHTHIINKDEKEEPSACYTCFRFLLQRFLFIASSQYKEVDLHLWAFFDKFSFFFLRLVKGKAPVSWPNRYSTNFISLKGRFLS